MANLPEYQYYACGDHAVTIALGNGVSVAVNEQVMRLYRYLVAQKAEAVLDIIPAYNSLTVVYNPLLLIRKYPGRSPYGMMQSRLQQSVAAMGHIQEQTARKMEIPVCYDRSLAPDMETVAALHQLPVAEVIRLHTATAYRVYMIGFLPGFAYMGSVQEKLITPRKATPRTCVPAGSVGIAGEQTGIYPLDSPGGWQLIGQTPLQLFNVQQANPCLLQPGDEVRFYPISLAEFQKLKRP
ncbi:MAG: 5-oxoprolinase subunit PxpB [Bacteroidetes bacterium]|nr:5-oxoprolinase subunit PxpB [Bacteroidota bacterium]